MSLYLLYKSNLVLSSSKPASFSARQVYIPFEEALIVAGDNNNDPSVSIEMWPLICNKRPSL